MKILHRPFLVLAAFAASAVAVLALAYFGMRSEYVRYRDGSHVIGTVVDERESFVDIAFTAPGGRPWTASVPRRPGSASHYPPGSSVDLRVTSGWDALPLADVDDLRPSSALLAAVVVAALCVVASVVLDRKLLPKRARRGEPLDSLAESIALTRNMRLVGAILLASFGAPILTLLIVAPTDTTSMILVAILAASLLGFAALFGAIAFRLRDPHRNAIFDLVAVRPQDLVKFYTTKHVVKGNFVRFITRSLTLETSGGRRFSLMLDGTFEQALLDEIARRAPHAAG